jgi:hypothetical protein
MNETLTIQMNNQRLTLKMVKDLDKSDQLDNKHEDTV